MQTVSWKKWCNFLYDKYVHVQKSTEEIVERIESESSHVAHLVKFENAYFNIMFNIEDFMYLWFNVKDVRA